MNRTHLIAVLIGIATIAAISQEAFARNRMYHPNVSRFMQRDPAGYVDGMNIYEYTKSNPLRYCDVGGQAVRDMTDPPDYWNDTDLLETWQDVETRKHYARTHGGKNENWLWKKVQSLKSTMDTKGIDHKSIHKNGDTWCCGNKEFDPQTQTCCKEAKVLKKRCALMIKRQRIPGSKYKGHSWVFIENPQGGWRSMESLERIRLLDKPGAVRHEMQEAPHVIFKTYVSCCVVDRLWSIMSMMNNRYDGVQWFPANHDCTEFADYTVATHLIQDMNMPELGRLGNIDQWHSKPVPGNPD